MIWKKVKKIPFKNVNECLRALNKKSYISPWIFDIFKKKKNINYKNYKNLEFHRIRVKKLGFKKATTLKKIYTSLNKKGYSTEIINNPKVKNGSIKTIDEEKKISSLIEANEIETENEDRDDLNIDEEIMDDEANSIGSDKMDDILIDVDEDDTSLEIGIETEDEDGIEK